MPDRRLLLTIYRKVAEDERCARDRFASPGTGSCCASTAVRTSSWSPNRADAARDICATTDRPEDRWATMLAASAEPCRPERDWVSTNGWRSRVAATAAVVLFRLGLVGLSTNLATIYDILRYMHHKTEGADSCFVNENGCHASSSTKQKRTDQHLVDDQIFRWLYSNSTRNIYFIFAKSFSYSSTTSLSPSLPLRSITPQSTELFIK